MKELHLRDVIKSIKLINIFDDVKHSHYFNEDISKLNEDEEEGVVLYDDDGSKIVLDKEALEFTDRYRTSTSDMMKDILGFDYNA